MTSNQVSRVQLGRRAFLEKGALVLTAASLGRTSLGAEEVEALKVGLITDLHHADKPAAGSRHYRETLDKLAEAGQNLAKQKPAFVVELGDFIDAADSVDVELGYLKRVNREFSAICKQRHYVLGNHCVYSLTKREFLDTVQKKKSYYSFDAGEFHFVVLDSCFRGDGQPYGRKNFEWTDPNVPAEEVEWLEADLKETEKKTIVFAHQRLDVGSPYGVKNAATLRRLFEASGRVLAVFQGHSHKNDYKDIAGIHYCTLVAMIEGSGLENNGYSTLSLKADGSMSIEGFRKQADYEWPA